MKSHLLAPKTIQNSNFVKFEKKTKHGMETA